MSMNFGHRRFTSQLDAYVDGELSVTSFSAVQAHLHDCPDCSAHVRMLIAMKNSLGRVANPYHAP